MGDVFSTTDKICALQNQDHWKPSQYGHVVLRLKESCMCSLGKVEY